MTAPYRHVESAKAFEPTDGYRDLRAGCPVHLVAEHEPPFYVLTRYEDVAAAARQPDVLVNRYGPGVIFQEAGALGTTDDPDHARHRRVLRSAFLPTAIERLAPLVERATDELLDAMLPHGEGDFVEYLAAPLPALAIAELFGIPDEERAEFHHLSNVIVHTLSSGELDVYRATKIRLEDIIERNLVVRDRLHDAGSEVPDDALRLIADARRDGTLSTPEARHIGYQVLVAGHETTTSLIGMMLYRLLERPEVMQQLRDDPELVPVAVEEALRFDSPAHGLFRTTAADVEIAGTMIPAGSKVQLSFASANRDPAQFSDPESFRIDRDRLEIGRHIAFGWGIHHCLGAPLARLTTRIAFTRWFARTSHIELAGTPERNDSFILHGLTSLPIRWRVQ